MRDKRVTSPYRPYFYGSPLVSRFHSRFRKSLGRRVKPSHYFRSELQSSPVNERHKKGHHVKRFFLCLICRFKKFIDLLCCGDVFTSSLVFWPGKCHGTVCAVANFDQCEHPKNFFAGS